MHHALLRFKLRTSTALMAGLLSSALAWAVEPFVVRDIRVVEQAMGDGVKRVYDSEIPVMKRLRLVPGVLAPMAKAG
jgi:hypothetical protein